MTRITGISLLAAVLFVTDHAASAQSNCKDAKGTLIELFTSGDTTTGAITNGGWLNGTTVSVFNTATFPTALPTQVTFGSTFALTTGSGELKGTRTYLFDFVALKAVTMTMIDPTTSSGAFAGATGVLYTTSSKISPGPPPTTFHEEVEGQVCFPK